MKILLTGGTGLIGQQLSQALLAQGHSLILLTRHLPGSGSVAQSMAGALSPASPASPVGTIPAASPASPVGPVSSPGPVSYYLYPEAAARERTAVSLLPAKLLAELDAIINLAGEPIIKGRWTAARRRNILESRVLMTRYLADSLAAQARRGGHLPPVWLNASATGYYGLLNDEMVDETSPAGSDFLARVCQAWEREALAVQALGVRVALIRIGIVLDRRGGALPRMVLPFRLGLGGPPGRGRQWVSWIHLQDLVQILVVALHDSRLAGPVNAVAPSAHRMTCFCQTLGHVLHRPSWLPVPGWALRLLLGGSAQVIIGGQHVVPAKLIQTGFIYQYPQLEPALRACLGPSR